MPSIPWLDSSCEMTDKFGICKTKKKKKKQRMRGTLLGEKTNLILLFCYFLVVVTLLKHVWIRLTWSCIYMLQAF